MCLPSGWRHVHVQAGETKKWLQWAAGEKNVWATSLDAGHPELDLLTRALAVFCESAYERGGGGGAATRDTQRVQV